jgi:hypothetical protein
MISFDHEVWSEFNSNPEIRSELLECFSRLYENVDDEEMWTKLYEALHYQGEVDQVSYAAVPHILEIERKAQKFNFNGFALIALIEHCRPTNEQPRAGEIADAYKKALDDVLTVVANSPQKDWDDRLTASILACIAFARGQRLKGWVLHELTEPYAKDWILANYNETDESLAHYAKSLL